MAYLGRQGQIVGAGGGLVSAFGRGGVDVPDTLQCDVLHCGGAATFDGAVTITGVLDHNGTDTFSAGVTFDGATGVNDVNIPDNLADALSFMESTNAYLTFVTTNSSESVASGQRLTTTDGVASGIAKIVGGAAYTAISASDNLLASAGASGYVDFAQTLSIPANTIKAGTRVRIRALVLANQVDGTDTLEVKITLGTTVLITATAFDPSAVTDYVQLEFEVIGRAAPGATASCVGMGKWVTSDNGTEILGHAIMAATNLATNGALVAKVSAKWSSTTALTNANLAILTVDIV